MPIVQKRAIELCREKARPVIVATQMLESMISAPRPTRAETSDVANAVFEGADAVMLSGETSVGQYPIEAVLTMSRIVQTAEQAALQATHTLERMPETVGGAIARAAAEVGAIVGAEALAAFTMSGETARRLSRYRSPIPLLAFTSVPATRGRLAHVWGVETFIVPQVDHTDAMFRQVEQSLLELGRCQKGDKVVVVAGSPPGTAGSTNALRVHSLGDAIAIPTDRPSPTGLHRPLRPGAARPHPARYPAFRRPNVPTAQVSPPGLVSTSLRPPPALVLRPHELVQPRHRLPLRHREVPGGHLGPFDA